MSAKERREKQFPGQHEGEEVEFMFRQHPLVMRKALILGLVAILVGILPLDFPMVYESPGVAAALTKLALAITGVVVLAWVYRWIEWYYTVFIVTDRRILEIRQRGLFDRKVDEWQLNIISNMNYHIGGFQAALFGFGDITAKTYVGELTMKTIHNPADIHERLMVAVKKAGGGSTPQFN